MVRKILTSIILVAGLIGCNLAGKCEDSPILKMEADP